MESVQLLEDVVRLPPLHVLLVNVGKAELGRRRGGGRGSLLGQVARVVMRRRGRAHRVVVRNLPEGEGLSDPVFDFGEVEFHRVGGHLAKDHVDGEHQAELVEAARGVAEVRLEAGYRVLAAAGVSRVREEAVLCLKPYLRCLMKRKLKSTLKNAV